MKMKKFESDMERRKLKLLGTSVITTKKMNGYKCDKNT